VPDEQKQELFQPAVLAKINLYQPRASFEKVFGYSNRLKYDTPEQHIENSLYFEIKTFLPALFIVGDKLSMANGLEERFPFMDNDLVSFAQTIPVKFKLANLELMKRLDENETGNKITKYQQYTDGKNVLRQAMKDIIPDAVLNRKKQGFSAPDENWYRGPNAEYIKELLLGKNIASAAYINPVYVKKIIDEHINKRINHRLLLWSLMCFEWWCRLFLNNQKLPE
jgi:asparagine synthase (glutamine-hydrolysing)